MMIHGANHAKYDDNYYVSNDGKVWSVKRKQYISSYFNKTTSYCQVSINGKTLNLHIVVCTAFHKDKNSGDEVHHKDNDRTNNSESNLEWISHRENTSSKNRKRKNGTSTRLNQTQYNDLFREYATGKHTQTTISSWANAEFKRDSSKQVYGSILNGTKFKSRYQQLPKDVIDNVSKVTLRNTKYKR
ncbi:HNH endonuclease signature motif containing protein [Pseudescherichia vulneris]|uniref:HNH endonuclease signature motif containing protein n=1 Tax=Pseudescherichia vulneris TaxID=566 RepID=UPI0028ACA70A|nr:HNH endonuclease signature motif containing protein [Pseudescherichia vulneris]